MRDRQQERESEREREREGRSVALPWVVKGLGVCVCVCVCVCVFLLLCSNSQRPAEVAGTEPQWRSPPPDCFKSLFSYFVFFCLFVCSVSVISTMGDREGRLKKQNK